MAYGKGTSGVKLSETSSIIVRVRSCGLGCSSWAALRLRRLSQQSSFSREPDGIYLRLARNAAAQHRRGQLVEGDPRLSTLKLLARRHPAALIVALALAGCASSQHRFQQEAAAPPLAEPAVLPALPPAFQPREIAGRWGFASCHKEGDRIRTEAAAKAQCDNPYVINLGPTGGVMMHASGG
jgi:hypothetical protein